MPRNDSVVYLDSSAIVKLVIHEPETEALSTFLRPFERLVSSILAEVEVTRVSRLHGPNVERQAHLLLDTLSIIGLTRDVSNTAGKLSPRELRSLDAIHLATALQLGASLLVLVAYDGRMMAAASSLGIPVASPA